MTFLDIAKRILPYDFRQKLKRKLFHVNDMTARLENLRNAGFKCTGFIDGGAYQGEWTSQFWRVFPESPSLLVEPLPGKQQALELIAQSIKGSVAITAALGRTSGIARFRVGETNSAVVGATEEVAGNSIEVRLATLDELLETAISFQPNLLKLDLQGYELECMEGCRDLAEKFEVIVIEISLIPIGGAPLFTQVDNYLDTRGYRIYDVIPQYYRPLDGSLWQCDAIYVRKDSALLASTRWE